MPRYPVTIDGQTIEVEADSPEGAARRAFAQSKATEKKEPRSFVQDLFAPEISGGPLRVIPGMVGGALGGVPGAMAGYGAGEYAAQKLEQATDQRKDVDPVGVGIATAAPAVVAGGLRAARGVGRTLTRTIPSMFERAQGKAATAGAEMVEGMRPAVDPGQLARAAASQGGDIIPLTTTQKVVNSITLPAKSANPQMEAVRTTVENIRAAGSTGQMSLRDLEAIRQDIGPLVGRSGAPAKLKGLYEGMIRDLESAASSGSPGAAMAREAATAFKQEMGASKVADLLTKASPTRVISGADVPALNVGTFAKLVNDPQTRQSLTRNVGPDAMKVIDRFIHDFRSLPPDVAFNGWNRMVLTLGGGAGGVAAGGAIGGIPGAMIGALTPELLTNMALVGKNPQQLQQLITTVAQAIRAGVATAPDEQPQ